LNSNGEAIEFIAELRGYMLEKLAILEERESKWRECNPQYPDGLSDEEFYPLLTLEYGLKKTRADIEWCDYAIQRIRSRSVS
jgi:hypothetical protein